MQHVVKHSAVGSCLLVCEVPVKPARSDLTRIDLQTRVHFDFRRYGRIATCVRYGCEQQCMSILESFQSHCDRHVPGKLCLQSVTTAFDSEGT